MHLVGEHHTPTRHTMRGLGTFMSIPNARSQDNARTATAIWSVAVFAMPAVRERCDRAAERQSGSGMHRRPVRFSAAVDGASAREGHRVANPPLTTQARPLSVQPGCIQEAQGRTSQRLFLVGDVCATSAEQPHTLPTTHSPSLCP